MIIAQSQNLRRDRLANLAFLRRLTPFSLHLTHLRSALIITVLIVGLASSHTAAVMIATIPAAVGSLLNYLAIFAPSYGPTNPLLRAYEAHIARTHGRPHLNLPAFVEITAALALLAVPGWIAVDLSPHLRLLCLAVTTTYLCSVSYSIFDDNAWYNPDVLAPGWQEVARRSCGPQIVILVLLVAGTGPGWDPVSRTGLAVVAAYGLVVPLLLMLNQQLTSRLSLFVEHERQHGTGFVIERTRQLLVPLGRAQQLALEIGDRAVAELAASAIESVATIPLHLSQADRPELPPPLPTVAERLAVLVESAGAEMSIRMPVALRLSEYDLRLAAQVVRDLVGNAISARARQIGLTVTVAGARMLIVVTDDGSPMPAGSWQAPGTSSALLAARLAERDGYLRVDVSADRTKAVVANWLTDDDTLAEP